MCHSTRVVSCGARGRVAKQRGSKRTRANRVGVRLEGLLWPEGSERSAGSSGADAVRT